MLAYVRFLFDDVQLVVPVSNIHKFEKPKDMTDFNGNASFPVHEVYWAGDCKTRGGYEVEVIYLADSEYHARPGGEKKRLASHARRRRPNENAVKERPAKSVTTQRKKARTQVRHKQELELLEELSSDSGLVPEKLVKQRDDHIRFLEKELQGVGC